MIHCDPTTRVELMETSPVSIGFSRLRRRSGAQPVAGIKAKSYTKCRSFPRSLIRRCRFPEQRAQARRDREPIWREEGNWRDKHSERHAEHQQYAVAGQVE